MAVSKGMNPAMVARAGLGPVASKVDHRAASRIIAPPITSGNVSAPPPSTSADADANTTSLSMMTEVTLARRRAAPYCRARLPSRKRIVRPSAQGASDQSGAAGQGTRPCSASRPPSTPETTAPPANIASARAASGWCASRRSMTLFSANEKPPSTPSQSARLRGQGQPELAVAPSGQSTTAAPASANPARPAAARVSGSRKSQCASSTAQSGIR